MDLEGPEGLNSFTLARTAQIQAKRRAVMPFMAPPPVPTPRDLQEADQARAVQAAWEDGWNAGRSAGVRKAGTFVRRSTWSSGT